MPYQILCNDAQRKGAKPSPDLASGLFCYVPLHKIWYGIDTLSVTGTCILSDEASPSEVKISVAAWFPTARELVSTVTVTVCCLPGSRLPVSISNLNHLVPQVSACHSSRRCLSGLQITTCKGSP